MEWSYNMHQLATDLHRHLKVIQLHFTEMFTENGRQYHWTISCDFLYPIIITCSCSVQENVAFHSLLQFFYYIVCLLWQLQTVNDKPWALRLLKTKLQTPPTHLFSLFPFAQTETYTNQTSIHAYIHIPATVWPARWIQTNIHLPPTRPENRNVFIGLFSPWGMVTKEDIKLKPDYVIVCWLACDFPACSFLERGLSVTNQWTVDLSPGS